MWPSPEPIGGWVDVVILATLAVLLLVYVRLPNSPIPGPRSGLTIVFAGVLLAALIQVLEAFPGPPLEDAILPGIAGFEVAESTLWVARRAALLLTLIGLCIAFAQRSRTERDADALHAARDAATTQAIESEERFRDLFETTSNAVYCYSFEPPMPTSLPLGQQIDRGLDAILTACNDVFAKELQREKSSDIIGTRMSLLESTKDTRSHAQYFADLIANDYRLKDYELTYTDVGGTSRALSVNVTGIVKNGCLERLWCAESNILGVKNTKKALHRRQAFQEMLANISSRLVLARNEEADEVMVRSLREVCEFLGGNRIFMVWGDRAKRTGEILYAWQADQRALLDEINLGMFPYFGRRLLDNETVSVADVAKLPQEAETDQRVLQQAGIRSFLVFPLSNRDEVIGFIGVAHDGKLCTWSTHDQLDLRVFGELFSSFVLRLRQRRALDDALDRLQDATERLQAENVYLRSEIKLSHDFDEIIGESEALRSSLQLVEQVADTMTQVLILGETGTGKELVARALHERSRRRKRTLVKVNCAALPANLIESELFGHEKGAFTSAHAAKRGRFDLAHGGTIFLDEIAEIPVALQAKLLRVLQEGEFERLGGKETIKVDARIIAATNRDLETACAEGKFRSDLFYRINTFPVELPPLRERRDDIRLLAEHFARQHAARLGRKVTAISADMMRELEAYDWPGNVRELEGVIQRALISTTGPVLRLAQPLAEPPARAGWNAGGRPVHDLAAVEREHIVSILEQSRWRISGPQGAAAELGINPSTLRSKMKKLGVVRPH